MDVQPLVSVFAAVHDNTNAPRSVRVSALKAAEMEPEAQILPLAIYADKFAKKLQLHLGGPFERHGRVMPLANLTANSCHLHINTSAASFHNATSLKKVPYLRFC